MSPESRNFVESRTAGMLLIVIWAMGAGFTGYLSLIARQLGSSPMSLVWAGLAGLFILAAVLTARRLKQPNRILIEPDRLIFICRGQSRSYDWKRMGEVRSRSTGRLTGPIQFLYDGEPRFLTGNWPMAWRSVETVIEHARRQCRNQTGA